MNSLEYWRKREQAQREKRIADEDERNRRIAQLYAEMQDAVQKQIDAFYGKYARTEGISIADAKKRAAQLDIDAYARKAKKYVKEKDFTDKANAEMKLYNMTMRVNRLELLKAEIGSELCAGFSDLEKEFDGDLMNDAIGEMRRQSGILGTTISDQAERARGLVDASFHNATFSDRIWMYQDMLKNELATLLQEGLIQGRNSKELARHLTKLFGVSEHDSERLMRTEMTRVYTAAQQESLTEAGYEEYTFIAEPTACDVCLALDGQHFPVADLEDIGNHAPPIHPNCRCSVAAYMDREEFDRWLDKQDNIGMAASELEESPAMPPADFADLKEAYKFINNNIIAKNGKLKRNNKVPVDQLQKAVQTIERIKAKYSLDDFRLFQIVTNNAKWWAEASGYELRIKADFLKDPVDSVEKSVNWWTSQMDLLDSWNRWYGQLKNPSVQDTKDYKDAVKTIQENVLYKRGNVVYPGREVESVLTHEMGHVIADQYFEQLNLGGLNSSHKGMDVSELLRRKQVVMDALAKARKTGDIYEISHYANKNQKEFFAECFTVYEMGVEELPDYLNDMIAEVVK